MQHCNDDLVLVGNNDAIASEGQPRYVTSNLQVSNEMIIARDSSAPLETWINVARGNMCVCFVPAIPVAFRR